jgi:hypothetical protein
MVAARLRRSFSRRCRRPLAGGRPVAIGARVAAVFTDVDPDLTLHGFRISER